MSDVRGLADDVTKVIDRITTQPDGPQSRAAIVSELEAIRGKLLLAADGGDTEVGTATPKGEFDPETAGLDPE